MCIPFTEKEFSIAGNMGCNHALLLLAVVTIVMLDIALNDAGGVSVIIIRMTICLFLIELVAKMVDFLIGHYTYRMFPPAIDIIPTSLTVAYSIRKYTNKKLMSHHVTYSLISRQYSCFRWLAIKSRKFSSSPEGGGGMACGNIL